MSVKVIPGVNDLETLFPEIAKEWHPANNDFLPSQLTAHSNRIVWWKCSKEHEWQAPISRRTGSSHSGCPICANRVVQKGYNDLLSNNPELCKQWDYKKNGNLKPDQISASSPKKVWWICDKGHSFEAIIYDRNIKKHTKCPYCLNQRFNPEYNSLAVLRPDLAEEWDYEKNYPLTPKDVLCGGDKKYWWKCKKQPHSFLQRMDSRIYQNLQCPYCSSQKLLPGFNDLETKRPDLLKLWNFEKNEILPSQVMEFSNVKAWWKCPDCGYEWKSSINTVSGSGTRCPKCSDVYKVSEPELIIYFYLNQYFNDAEITSHPSWLNNREIDIYIPSIRLAIEYDGEFWHRNTNKRDLEKSKVIIEHGDSLIRVREGKLPEIDDGSFVITVPALPYNYERLTDPIRKIFDWINKNRSLNIVPDVDVNRDWKKVLATEKAIKKERSIVTTNPEIAKYWNYERNGGLKPDQVFAGSNKKVWWKCPDCGYEWEALVANMTKRHTECQVCRKKRELSRSDSDQTLIKSRGVFAGINDLVTLRPDLVAEWNYEKNDDLNPEKISNGSSRRVWWKCSVCGHEWKTSIANRNYGFGCPSCGRKKAGKSNRYSRLKRGENDLATVNPYVASQWNYEKNEELTPESISVNSNLKVWWKCKDCGNEWDAIISSRKNADKCPFCTNRRFKRGFNDIFSVHPELKKEWDYEKNAGIDPEMVICTSNKKVWWICSKCGNSWQTSVGLRSRGSGCPDCNSKKAIINRKKNSISKGNCFGIIYPEISTEWLHEKNNGITPFDITAHNGNKYWWKCSVCGYEWEATPSHRAVGTGCPICRAKTMGEKRRKKVKNLDTGEIFVSLSEAAEKYKISPSSISCCCNGKVNKSGGYRWKYLD